jgi:hypothetical protein
LNTTGQRLSAQEIRVAVYRGALLDLIEELNEIREWRQVFGKPHPRLKDRELILRFFALYANADSYERPLAEFLSKFALKNRNPTAEELKLFRETFISTIKLIFEILGAEAFRPERALNAAVFDSVMIGLAKRLSRGKIAQTDQIKASYKKLTTNPEYLSAVTDATSDKPNVEKRIKLATAAFSHIK